MATKLSAFPGVPPYDWDQWLDGSAWLLRKGEDYDIESASMRAAASRAAKERGKRVRTAVVTDDNGVESVAVQAYEPS